MASNSFASMGIVSCYGDTPASIPTWYASSGEGTVLFPTDQNCSSYSVLLNFKDSTHSPALYMFDAPQCDDLIELAFPSIGDLPSGAACLVKVCDGISVSAVRIAIINDSSNNTALASRAGIKGTAACRQSGNETADQVVQISGPPWGNSTHPGIMAPPGNSSSASQNSTAGNWTGTGLGSSMDPAAGMQGVGNSQQGGAPTAVGSGSQGLSSGLDRNLDFPSGTDIGAGPAPTTSGPGTGIAGPAGTDGPSTLVTVTTPNRPGQDGKPGAIDGDTATGTVGDGAGPAGPGAASTGPVASATGTDFSSPSSGPGANLNVPSQSGAPNYTVDGQVIPGGGNTESGGLQTGTALAPAQVTGGNGDKSSVNGGDSVVTGGANLAQPGPASTCLCK